jgi:hypothetical protein
MKYDVTLEVRFTHPNLSILDIAEAISETPFTVHAKVLEGDRVALVCHGVQSDGLMALPEALRKAQVGISHALKESVPGFAGRGLLWGDVVAAHVHTAE